MKGFNRICACIVGLVFLVAGLLKLMDPVGARLVLQDYFAFFHIGFLRSAAGLFAVIFALAESMIGAALITGVWRRIVALVSGCLLAFFTLLTLIILIANPAMDCGCFGQAIKLSHGATFVKNLLLCGIWGLAFLPLRDYGQPQRVKFVSFSIAASCAITRDCNSFFMPANLISSAWAMRCTGMPDIMETTFAISSASTTLRSSFNCASHSAFMTSSWAINSFSLSR